MLVFTDCSFFPLLQLSHKPSKCSPAQIRRLASQVDGTRLWEAHLRPILIERLPGTQGSLSVQQVGVNIYIASSLLHIPPSSLTPCSTSAHHLHPVLAVCWLVHRPGLVPVPYASRPGHFHQRRGHSGPFGTSTAAPGLPLWLQGAASRPASPGEGVPGGQRFCSALRYDPGARHLSGCSA